MIPYQWSLRPPIVTRTGSIPILISTDPVYGFRAAGPPHVAGVRVAGFPHVAGVRVAGFPPVICGGGGEGGVHRPGQGGARPNASGAAPPPGGGACGGRGGPGRTGT